MLFRLLIWGVLIYLVARLLAKVINAFLAGSRQPPSRPESPAGSPHKRTVEYDDVSDAKFVDVPNSPTEEGTEHQEPN